MELGGIHAITIGVRKYSALQRNPDVQASTVFCPHQLSRGLLPTIPTSPPFSEEHFIFKVIKVGGDLYLRPGWTSAVSVLSAFTFPSTRMTSCTSALTPKERNEGRCST
jgi:hypothetical protein